MVQCEDGVLFGYFSVVIVVGHFSAVIFVVLHGYFFSWLDVSAWIFLGQGIDGVVKIFLG